MSCDTSDLKVKRGMTVVGYDNIDHGGHVELRVSQRDGCPQVIPIADTELGIAIAQMRLGQQLSGQGVVSSWITSSRVKLEQLLLLVFKIIKPLWTLSATKNTHREIQTKKYRHLGNSASGFLTR